MGISGTTYCRRCEWVSLLDKEHSLKSSDVKYGENKETDKDQSFMAKNELLVLSLKHTL